MPLYLGGSLWVENMVRHIQKYCKIDGKRAGENNIGERDLRDMLGIFYFRITRTPLVKVFLEKEL